MALEWAALAMLSAAQAILLVFITFPGMQKFRRGVIQVANRVIQPFLAVVPLACFLLLDVYLKYENRLKCQGSACTNVDREHFAKQLMKSQRNALLAISAILFYWLLVRVTAILSDLERAETQLKRSRED